jgi:hypothetical protein
MLFDTIEGFALLVFFALAAVVGLIAEIIPNFFTKSAKLQKSSCLLSRAKTPLERRG